MRLLLPFLDLVWISFLQLEILELLQTAIKEALRRNSFTQIFLNDSLTICVLEKRRSSSQLPDSNYSLEMKLDSIDTCIIQKVSIRQRFLTCTVQRNTCITCIVKYIHMDSFVTSHLCGWLLSHSGSRAKYVPINVSSIILLKRHWYQ